MTDKTPNIPEVVEEVRGMFERYEQALIDKNVDVLDATFWNSPHTIRLANYEHGYGFDRIHAHRVARPPGPGTKEKRHRLDIVTLGRDVATVTLVYKVRGQGPGRSPDADLGALSRCRLEGDRRPRLDNRQRTNLVRKR